MSRQNFIKKVLPKLITAGYQIKLSGHIANIYLLVVSMKKFVRCKANKKILLPERREKIANPGGKKLEALIICKQKKKSKVFSEFEARAVQQWRLGSLLLMLLLSLSSLTLLLQLKQSTNSQGHVSLSQVYLI